MATCCTPELPKASSNVTTIPTAELCATSRSLLASPPTLSRELRDFKDTLIEFRNECAEAALRQEALFKHLLDQQNDLKQQIILTMNSGAKAPPDVPAPIQSIVRYESVKRKSDNRPSLQFDNTGTDATQCDSNRTSRTFVQRLSSQLSSTAERSIAHMIKKADESTVSRCLESSSTPSNRRSSASSYRSKARPSNKSNRETGYGSSSLTFMMSMSVESDHLDSVCARVDRLLKRREFELAVACTILINAVVMFFEAQYLGLQVGFNLQYPGRPREAQVVWPAAEKVFEVFGWFFGVLFLCEFIVKFACWRMAYFVDRWNLLDSLCVVVFIVDKVLIMFASADSFVNPHMLRLLRLLRLARLVRLIRFLESLEALYVMTTAIAGMSRILGWAVFLLTVMLLTCDIFLVQMLQATYFSDVVASDLSKEALEKHQEMYSYFGTCTRCILSMFEITLGNWPPIARLLSEEVSEWFIVLCLIHKLTIGFAVVGVITGVILQETFKVAQTDDLIMLRQRRRAAQTMKNKMKNLFEAINPNDEEPVQFEEFKRVCEMTDIKFWLASLDIETDEEALKTMFRLCDRNGDGVLNFEELADMMPRIRGAARSIDVLALHEKLDAMKKKP